MKLVEGELPRQDLRQAFDDLAPLVPELLIDREEVRVRRAMLVDMLREMGREQS